MEYLHSLLKFAVNMSASDIHVKPGHHATIRISGELFPVQVDPPTAEQVEEIVRHMLPKHLESRLDREKEADFSYIERISAVFASTSSISADCQPSSCVTSKPQCPISRT